MAGKGPIQYDEHKFEELILYLCKVSEGDETFGATKLNKTLFYSDFRAYAVLGRPITGADYQKLQHGPAPRQLVPTRQRLIQRGDADEHAGLFGDRETKRLLALRTPDLTCFTAEEIAVVHQILRWAQQHSATELSALSHAFAGWELASTGETIPYESVFLPQERQPLNDDELAQMDEVAARIAGRGVKLPR